MLLNVFKDYKIFVYKSIILFKYILINFPISINKINFILKYFNQIFFYHKYLVMGIGDWGLGIGDWGLGDRKSSCRERV